MQYNIRNKTKPYFILIGIAIGLILIAFYTIIREQNDLNKEYLQINNEENTFDNTANYMDFSYITMSVTDYEQESQSGDFLEWQSRYSIITSSSSLYINGYLSKEQIHVSDVDEILSFDPESSIVNKDVKSKVEKNKYGILHCISLEESEQYIAGLLKDGYVLRRKIITPTYVETYLLDTEDRTTRIIAFKEYMLVAKLDRTELPEIKSYFE